MNKRLRVVASMVDKDIDVIDVGCDHALLDIYLTKCNNNKCIASDISKNALNQAIENIKKNGLEDKIEVILSDGLKNIETKKNTTVVISGMGTNTIVSILKDADRKNIENIIIQSNNDLNNLRREVVKLGYMIIDEEAVLDKNIFYVVIKFKKGNKKYNKNDYSLGPILKNKDSRVEYYKYLKSKNEEVLKNIPRRYFKLRYKIKKTNQMLK